MGMLPRCRALHRVHGRIRILGYRWRCTEKSTVQTAFGLSEGECVSFQGVGGAERGEFTTGGWSEMMRKSIWTLCVGVLFGLASMVMQAAAPKYDALYVFGDSYC